NKKLVNALNRKSLPLTGDGMSVRGFVGWTVCRNCHREQVKSWQASRHATSHLTLVEKGQQFNLECLPCHVTGADHNDPAAAIGRAADLQVVGCESCHGPGSIHSLNPASRRTAPITEKICLACHTPEQDDSFDFGGGLKKLKCEIQDDRARRLR
ncbi:MAG: multiheme c-type cytochrome, partial [Desulfurivibrionaceae bacterium]